MVNEALMSDPVDPLNDLAGINLFPRTIRASTDAPVSVDPQNLESVHNLMKLMEIKSHEKLLEEARAIVDNGAELLNTKFASLVQSMGIDQDLAMKGKEKPQERRPGLGRKRPKFSLKPSTSQPSVSLGPTLDIDQLQDPIEFFSVAEKLEDAEKEIKRQKGSNIHNLDMNDMPTNTRRRRPGILGKSVRYKHSFTSTPFENDDAFISSQETIGHDILDEPNSQLPQEPPCLNVESQEADCTGSIEKTENRVDEILDELLSSNGEDLEGDRVLYKLQERLQIKPIELGSLCIPEFPMTGNSGGKAFGERIQKPRRSSLEIYHLVKGTTEGSPSMYRQDEENLVNNLASPTPPKSPFASLSLLKKRILQSNPLRDPFSPLNIDLYNIDPQSKHQPEWSMKMNKQCINKDIGEGESHGETEDLAGCENINVMVPSSGSEYSHEQLMEKTSGRYSVNFRPNGSQTDVEQQDVYEDMDVRTADCNIKGRNLDNNHQSDWLDKTKDVLVINNVMKDKQGVETESYVDRQKMQDEEVLGETLPSVHAQGNADDTANCSIETTIRDFGSTETDRQVDDMLPQAAYSAEQDRHCEDPAIVKNLNSDQSNSAAVEGHATQVTSTFPEMSPEKHAQIHRPNDKQKKVKRHAGGIRERKALSYRPSLADAGTSFESGVRRSKRMKTRPLEYWKGERLLYGRVNQSLKLIGLKYISPAKGSVKVKSYISDDYKDLVDLAARY